MTEAERNYLGAAASYLKTGNEEGMRVAQTMAGAANGSSTLGDIKTAISSAKRIENAGYQGDYKNRIKGNIPSSVADVAANVEETHRSFQAAMTEVLEYWDDQNTAHIVSGTSALQHCFTFMNTTIAQTTEKMKSLSTVARAPAVGAQPSGYRAIKWGTAPQPGLKKFSDLPDGLIMYVPTTTPLPLFEIPVAEEDYTYSHGKFYSADAYVDGESNLQKMKAALVNKFGQPSFANESLSIWRWKWPDKVEISLSYQAKFARSTVNFVNNRY